MVTSPPSAWKVNSTYCDTLPGLVNCKTADTVGLEEKGVMLIVEDGVEAGVEVEDNVVGGDGELCGVEIGDDMVEGD
jgi:hypothetical protein